MFTQTISFLLGRSAERVRKCSASFMSILMFSSSHLLLHLPVKYVLELHSVSCSRFYTTVWLFFFYSSPSFTHTYTDRLRLLLSFFILREMVVVKKKKKEKKTAPCWKYLAGTPHRFCFISFKFPFLLFSLNFHSPTNPSVSPRLKAIAMLGYMFMGRLMITSAARAAKKKPSQLVSSNSLKEEEELFFFLVSCFIFGICCKNIFILREEEEGEWKKILGKESRTIFSLSQVVVWRNLEEWRYKIQLPYVYVVCVVGPSPAVFVQSLSTCSSSFH